MRHIRLGLLAALPAALVVCVAGCNDVGDNWAGPPEIDATNDGAIMGEPDGASSEGAASEGGAGDAGGQGDGSTPAPDVTVEEPVNESGASGMDTGIDSTTENETGAPETGAPEAAPETGVPETGPEETGAPETGTPDTGAQDTGTESGVQDSGPDSTVEAGPLDSGGHDGAGEESGADSSTHDASEDTGTADTGAPDTGTHDAGTDSSGTGPTPCTTFPCAATGPNSVHCDGNTASGSVDVCTPTEALYVAKDIAAGNLTAGQLDPSTSCYECMVANGGLDDSGGDMGNECGDVPASAPTLTGEAAHQACIDTLSCIISSHCDTDAPPSLCLCGTAAGSACLTAGAANGPCLQNEINGLDIGTGTTLGSLVEGDPTATQKAYTDKMLGSGMANAIGAFAFSNCQTQCTP